MGLAPSSELAQSILDLHGQKGEDLRPKPRSAKLVASQPIPRRAATQASELLIAPLELGGAVLINYAPSDGFQKITTITVLVRNYNTMQKIDALRRAIDYVCGRSQVRPAELGKEQVAQSKVPVAVDYVQICNCKGNDLLAPEVLRVALYGHPLTHAL